jgi:hypothetical protein
MHFVPSIGSDQDAAWISFAPFCFNFFLQLAAIGSGQWNLLDVLPSDGKTSKRDQI